MPLTCCDYLVRVRRILGQGAGTEDVTSHNCGGQGDVLGRSLFTSSCRYTPMAVDAGSCLPRNASSFKIYDFHCRNSGLPLTDHTRLVPKPDIKQHPTSINISHRV